MRSYAAAGVILTLGLCSGAARAQADDPARIELAREVVRTTHAADNMRKVMPLLANQMRTLLTQQGQADSKSIDAFVERFQARMSSETDGFVDLAAQVYAKEFSQDDLKNLLTFYHTPTGQKVVDEQPVIAQAMIVAGQTWGQNIAKEVIADMQKDKASAPPPKL